MLQHVQKSKSFNIWLDDDSLLDNLHEKVFTVILRITFITEGNNSETTGENKGLTGAVENYTNDILLHIYWTS